MRRAWFLRATLGVAVAFVVPLLAGGCGAASGGSDGPAKDGLRSVEVSQTYASEGCRLAGAESALVQVGPGDVLSVDVDGDGSADAFRDGGRYYLQWAGTGAAGPTWIWVPVDPSAPETAFLFGLQDGADVIWLFQDGKTPLDAAEKLRSEGRASPAEVDGSGEAVLSWETARGVAVSAAFENAAPERGYPDSVRASSVLLDDLDRRAPGAVPLGDVPAVDAIGRSMQFQPGCSDTSADELARFLGCAQEAAGDLSVRRWVGAMGPSKALFPTGVPC